MLLWRLDPMLYSTFTFGALVVNHDTRSNDNCTAPYSKNILEHYDKDELVLTEKTDFIHQPSKKKRFKQMFHEKFKFIHNLTKKRNVPLISSPTDSMKKLSISTDLNYDKILEDSNISFSNSIPPRSISIKQDSLSEMESTRTKVDRSWSNLLEMSDDNDSKGNNDDVLYDDDGDDFGLVLSPILAGSFARFSTPQHYLSSLPVSDVVLNFRRSIRSRSSWDSNIQGYDNLDRLLTSSHTARNLSRSRSLSDINIT